MHLELFSTNRKSPFKPYFVLVLREKRRGGTMRKNRKAVLWTCAIVVALGALVINGSSSATMTPLIMVQPSNTANNSPSQGMRFHINITIQNVSNCGSVQMTLIFNGTQIAVVGVSFLPDANLPSPTYFQSGNGFMSTNVTFGSPISTVSPVTIIDLTFKLYNRYCQSSLHIDSLVVADSSGQTLQSNSEDGSVQIRLIGDINADSVVDLYDALILANAYGSTQSAPNWNPYADLNHDGVVDVFDAIILVSHFGT
jgi:hypothetical protein